MSKINNEGNIEDLLKKYSTEKELISKSQEVIFLKKELSTTLSDKGKDYYFDNHLVEALTFLNRALEFDEDNMESWSYKARVLQELNRVKESQECYDKALELHPNYSLSELMELSQSHINNPFVDDPFVDDPFVDDPFVDDPFSNLSNSNDSRNDSYPLKEWDDFIDEGRSFRKQNRFEEAIRSYDAALNIKSDYSPLWYYKSVALAHLERFDEALDCLDNALKIDHNIDAIRQKKIILDYLSSLEVGRIAWYDAALKYDSNNPKLWYNKAFSLNYLLDGTGDRVREAIYCLNQALKLKPNFSLASKLKREYLEYLEI